MSDKIPDFFGEDLSLATIPRKEAYVKEHELRLADCAEQNCTEVDEKAECSVVAWRQPGASFSAYKQREKRYSARYFTLSRKQFRRHENVRDESSGCIPAALAVQAVYSRTAETKLFI